MIIEPKDVSRLDPVLELIEQKPEWHAPLLTKIEIRRTLLNCSTRFTDQSEDLYLTN